MKIKLLISYDGSPFVGWQKQSSGAPSVQGHLEQALSSILDEPTQVVGSGRTDAGVHAMGQVAHIKTDKDMKKYNLIRAANSLTPDEIVVHEAWQAPDDFHAIGSATAKTYKYLLFNSPIPHAFRHKYSTWVRRPLDLSYLSQLSQQIVGTHDFKSFQTRGTESPTTTRQILRAKWRKLPENLVEFSITGEGFLKQMVRNLVGTMLDLEYQKAPLSQLREILEAKDRQSALGTAPSQGLYLYRVYYSQELDNKCRKI